MRRISSLTAVTTLLLGTLLLAAPPSAAGGVGRLVMSGNTAEFEWNTCTDPGPGDVCSRTMVLASDQVVHESNDDSDPAVRGELIRWGGPAAFLRIWDYSLDANGEYVPIRESFGSIGVPGIPGSAGNPVVRIDTRLRSITVRATDLRMDVFEADGTTHREYRTVSLTGTGTGPLQRIREGSMMWKLGLRDVVRAWGWARAATATAQVDGRPVPGTFLGGRLQHGTYTEVLVLKGQVASAAATLLMPAAPVRASGALSRFQVAAGDAAWSSCETAGVGETCSDVYIAYDDHSVVAGPRSTTATLRVWVSRVIDIADGLRFTEDVSSLTAYDVPAEVVASARLAGATVTVPDALAEACQYGGLDQEPVCAAQPVGFSAVFTGTGDAQRFASHVISWGGGTRFLQHLTGWSRPAQVVAQVGGASVAQPFLGASISSGRGFAK